jgi:hypothetical protein
VGNTIDTLLKGKKDIEKSNLKSIEIAKTRTAPKQLVSFSEITISLEIMNIKRIDGGVEVLAKAWGISDAPIGFGKDGSVEIERFKIYNPPVMVDDINGSIVRSSIDFKGNTILRRLREDPLQAIIESLTHTAGVVGKRNSNITKGKVGNTTSTFYPDSGKPGSTSVDGEIRNQGAVYSTVHDAATGTTVDVLGVNLIFASNAFLGTTYYLDKIVANFDTSPIADSDTISSAICSFKHNAASFGNVDSDSISLVDNTITSDVDYVVGDFAKFGTTKLGTDILVSTLSNGVYMDIPLNGTGIAAISKTGVTHFGLRTAKEIANTTPSGHTIIGFDSADVTGTSSDPKLVVVHGTGRIMGSLVGYGGLAGIGGLAGQKGGLAG